MASEARSNDSEEREVQKPRKEAVREETRRIRRLQRVVALAQQTLATQVDTKGEAIAVMNGTRDYALELFPGQGDTFDIIYGTRLMRIYRARFERPGETG